MSFPSKFIIAMLIAGPYGWAQSTTALLFGTVRDASGSGGSGAEVKISEQRTGLARSATTASDGNYEFTLPRGLYNVSVGHAGFKTEVREAVALSTEDRVRVDINLSIGETTESVAVSAMVRR